MSLYELSHIIHATVAQLPTITKELLLKSLDFAENYTKITDIEKDIIVQAKHTTLFHNSTPWKKANSHDLFDVTMGSSDGAETCELVGTFILNKISSVVPKENIDLYKDDGLAVICKPAPIVDEIKRNLCDQFRELGLRITADANTTVTDFLDVTFDLTKREHRPYSKPGNTHLYVHIESNHPPIITKRIPNSIETRLPNISSNERIFNDAKQEYQKALQEAGHKTHLKYQIKNATNQEIAAQKNKRQRKITWFNPPYSVHVKSNIGKSFLVLIEQHFPANHDLHRICNKNTLKLSYSCMDNMGKLIKAHNNKILKPKDNEIEAKCNCRNKDKCPLPGKCTTKSVIYEADVSTTNSTRTYVGLTSNTFKTRYMAHKSTFTNREKESSTELSKHIWKLKEENTPFETSWKIIKQAKPYSPSTKRCNLCLWEKYYIITANKVSTLNSRTELVSTCRHKRKFLLSEYG